MSLYSDKTSQQNTSYRKETSLPGNVLWKKCFKKLFLLSHKETPRCPCFSAVFTLEAAIILPLLASFFVSILFFFRVMEIELVVQHALNDTARQLAISLADEVSEQDVMIAQMLFWSELGKEELTEQYVLGGRGGISLAQSGFDAREVRLRANYQIRLPVRIFWSRAFTMEQRADCRKWNGWSAGEQDDGADRWVYITQTGTVYHCERTCTHLDLSIRSVSKEQIGSLRNENGERYRRCSQCTREENELGIFYITNQGNRYHNSLNCSGMKRTVYMVRMSDIEGRSPCSRCGR